MLDFPSLSSHKIPAQSLRFISSAFLTANMKKISLRVAVVCGLLAGGCSGPKQPAANKLVPPEVMEEMYQEVKTPVKHGVVFQHPDTSKMIDSPTIFREGDGWYMTYLVFDGQGYETWLAESADLLHWESKGKILSFTENTWDANQKAGYVSLVDIAWG